MIQRGQMPRFELNIQHRAYNLQNFTVHMVFSYSNTKFPAIRLTVTPALPRR